MKILFDEKCRKSLVLGLIITLFKRWRQKERRRRISRGASSLLFHYDCTHNSKVASFVSQQLTTLLVVLSSRTRPYPLSSVSAVLYLKFYIRSTAERRSFNKHHPLRTALRALFIKTDEMRCFFFLLENLFFFVYIFLCYVVSCTLSFLFGTFSPSSPTVLRYLKVKQQMKLMLHAPKWSDMLADGHCSFVYSAWPASGPACCWSGRSW